jgi:hypothetical protein
LTGDCGVGAVTFNVDPSGAASPVPGSAAVGETGVDDCFEQAIARARTAADAQATNFLCCIRKNLVEPGLC